jgi:transketolase
MAGASEVGEEIEHAVHENKGIALLIAILALLLAFASAGGKGAQTQATAENIHASDLWAFYQAKAIRATTMQTAAETMQTEIGAESNSTTKAAKEAQIKAWKETAARYESEPATHDGKKELAERAKEAEEHREISMAKYEHYEIASAALEIGIVLCSATIITGMAILAWAAGGLAIIGIAFMGFAMFAPLAVHLF